MRGAKQMQFGGAVARALLIGVELGGLDGVRINSGSKMGKLQVKSGWRAWAGFDIIPA